MGPRRVSVQSVDDEDLPGLDLSVRGGRERAEEHYGREFTITSFSIVASTINRRRRASTYWLTCAGRLVRCYADVHDLFQIGSIGVVGYTLKCPVANGLVEWTVTEWIRSTGDRHLRIEALRALLHPSVAVNVTWTLV